MPSCDIEVYPMRLLAAILVLGCVLLSQAYGLIIEVPPNNQECVFEILTLNERMIASYEVIAGGLLDINLKVRFNSNA